MKILVIGGGSMGRRRLRDLVYLNPGGELLFEPVPERCEEAASAFAVPGFKDLDLAFRQQPDALVISTPPALHEAYVQRGIDQGAHVFAEVPFVLDYDALKRIVEKTSAAGQRGLLAVSHTIRYYPPYRLIHDLLVKNAVGRPLYLEYSLGNYLPDWHPHEDYRKFYANNQKLGGAGMDMLLHELSAIHWWLGKTSWIQSRLAKVSSLEISGPDTHDILMRFENGALGFFHHDVIERGTLGRHIRVLGENGTLEWHQNQKTVRLYTAKENRNDEIGFEMASDWQSAMEASREATRLLATQRSGSGYVPGDTPSNFTYESCYLREMRHYLDAIQGTASYTGCTIEEELHTVAAFHSIVKSDKQKQEVAVE